MAGGLWRGMGTLGRVVMSVETLYRQTCLFQRKYTAAIIFILIYFPQTLAFRRRPTDLAAQLTPSSEDQPPYKHDL